MLADMTARIVSNSNNTILAIITALLLSTIVVQSQPHYVVNPYIGNIDPKYQTTKYNHYYYHYY